MKIGKRTLCIILAIIMCVTFDCWEGNSAVYKNTIGFYSSALPSGIAKTGPIILATSAGYTNSGTVNDSTAEVFYAALSSYDVVFVHAHGAAGLIQLSKNGNAAVTGNSISEQKLTKVPQLLYLSACYAGNGSTANGSIGSVVCTIGKGENAVVAFTGTISASSSTNGIHRFNELVIAKASHNVDLYQAIKDAQTQIYEETGQYWGSDTCVFTGNGGLQL